MLVQRFDLLAALWSAHLQPLWNELTACLGAVAALLLTLWNTVLALFVQWLITALAPVAVQVFAALGTAVTGAAGIIARTVSRLRWRGCAVWPAFFGRRAAGRVGRCPGLRWPRRSLPCGAHRLHCADGGLHGAGRCAQHGRGHCGGHQRAAVGHWTCQKSMAGSVLGGAGKLVSSQSALPGLGYAAAVPVPALARSGHTAEPPVFWRCSVTRQPARTWKRRWRPSSRPWRRRWPAGRGSADGQPINVYIGEELLDSVIANSQNRRALRSGGR